MAEKRNKKRKAMSGMLMGMRKKIKIIGEGERGGGIMEEMIVGKVFWCERRLS